MVGEGSLPDGLSWTFILKDSESSVVIPMTYCHSILWLLFWVIDTLGGTPKESPGFQTDLFSHTVEQPNFPLTSVNKGTSFSAYWFSGIKSMFGIWLPIRWTHYCVPWKKNWRLRPPKQHRSVLLGKEQKFCKWVLDISEQLPLLSLDSQIHGFCYRVVSGAWFKAYIVFSKLELLLECCFLTTGITLTSLSFLLLD